MNRRRTAPGTQADLAPDVPQRIGSTSTESSAGAESSDESAQFDNADVTFVQGMVPHHRGALEMTQMTDGRAEDPRVIALAEEIADSQAAEIEERDTLLAELGG